MAFQKVPRPSTVYHLTQKGNLDSILDDGRIRRFSDTECWFCESLEDAGIHGADRDVRGQTVSHRRWATLPLLQL